jgi:hypothetical protein
MKREILKKWLLPCFSSKEEMENSMCNKWQEIENAMEEYRLSDGEPKIEKENFLDRLKKYFDETPREKVLEDWEKTKEFDK